MFRERAMTVSLEILSTSGKKMDRSAGGEVAENHSANYNAVEVYKKLYKTSTFETMKSLEAQIRVWFEKRTLPWEVKGQRLLPSKLFFEFNEELSKWKSAYHLLASRFIAEYDDMVSTDRIRLGSLFNEKDYPPVEKMKEKFGINVFFAPLPEAIGQLEGLAIEAMEEINKNIQISMLRSQEAAMKDIWNRIYDAVSHLHKRCSSDGRLYESAFESVNELVDILPKLNITDDPNLEAIRQELQNKLYGTIVENVRKDDAERAKVASDAEDILKTMEQFFNPAS